MTDDTNGRSADEIARDVESSRARVTETLDELKARMSPGQLLDEMLAYTKGAGGEFLSNAGRAARDNPLPVLLVGAGLALLATSRGGASDSRSRSYRSYTRDRGYMYGDDGRSYGYGEDGEGEPGILDRVGATASGVASSVSDAASRVSEAASSGVRRTRDTMGHVADTVGGAASAASEAGSEMARRTAHAASSVRDTLASTTDYARRAIHDRRDDLAWAGSNVWRRATQVMEEQPLAVGALGLLVGAALGSILPRSRVEDAWMGEYAEEARHQALEMAEAGYQEAKHVVQETVRTVSDELGQRGLDADSLKDAASAAAERAREAARKAVEGATGATPTGGESGPASSRAVGGEGYVPPSSPGSQEGLGGPHREAGSGTAPGAPSTRSGPVI
ncbi:DUF3618 domain-containing protein [Alsobacter sp. R-9]